jgi:diguanylate cyclase (GGDEF)-like protein
LPNRIYFNEILEKTLKLAQKSGKKIAILFIDLDRFKTINDALGHHIGDLVLKEVAIRINAVLRQGDLLARLGGDEFIIMLNDIDSEKFTNAFADRVLKIFNHPIIIKNHEFFITASVGICVFPDDGETLEDLQRNADMAMYQAKRSGGDVFQYFTKEMNFKASEHIKLESMLRKALKNDELLLHYQPKYHVESGLIAGVEALIRWNHPEHGMISPARFIPHAEEAGLILQIGEWVIKEACRACKRWQERGYDPVTVAVNISPKQFRHQDITKLISEALDETKLDPQYLEIEITESAVMEDIENAAKKLNELNAMGIRISIDDFGTGYTSISYLKQFPVSILKIDQNFIKGIPANANDIAITIAVIALAHSLGIEVIAEGVESSEQMQWLADHNCDMVQGYFLSRPLSEDKFISEISVYKVPKSNEPASTE